MKMIKATEAKKGGIEIEDYLLTATEKNPAQIEKKIKKQPLNWLWTIIIASVIILGLRMIYLNVIKGSYYQKVAQENRIRSIIIKAPRGKILDQTGEILVNNVPSVDVVVIPADIARHSDEKEKIVKTLSDVLKINEGEIKGKIETTDPGSLEPVLIRENVSREESLLLAEKGQSLPGVMVEKTAVREYLDGPVFSHIIGYEGKISPQELAENSHYLMTDYIGKQGIEKAYESDLRGESGALRVEVDSLGKIKRELGTLNPKPGSDLVLSINAKLQKKIFEELSAVLEKSETKTAAAVAINPQDGKVLALVSLPSFDNNSFVKGFSGKDYQEIIADPDNPFFNRVVSGAYPPGSTLKPLIAAAALSEKTINSETSVDCHGGISVGSWQFGDWKTHGTTDVRKAIAESCDVFFYSVGGGYGNITGLGMSRMKKYETLFGLGDKTGIDLPGEVGGFIPDEGWKLEKFGEKWFVGNSYHAAIGQGYVTVTPVQLVNYISAIANNGILYRPKIVSQVKRNGGNAISIPSEEIGREFVSPEVLKIVQEGMRQTVTFGTATSLADLPVAVAGKTGTAQYGVEKKVHNWFVSYTPYDNPEIAMVVLVEGGSENHSSATAVTKEVYKWYFGERK